MYNLTKGVSILLLLHLMQCTAAIGQNNIRRPTVFYDKFELVSGDEKYRALENYLPVALATHFVNFPIAFEKIQPSTSKLFPIESIDSAKYDYYLSADFSIFNGHLFLNPYLYDLRSRSYNYFESSSTSLPNILTGIRAAGDLISRHILDNAGQSTNRKSVSVKCITSKSNNKMAASYAENLSLGLNVNIQIPSIVLKPLQQSENICGSDIADLEAARLTGSDLLISGEIDIKDGHIIVTPRIFIKEDSSVIYLPSIIESQLSYSDLEDHVLNDIDDFFESIINNPDLIKGTKYQSNKYEDFWDRGDVYFSHAEYYLAAFMFNKALILNPSSYEVMTNLGIVRKWQERYDEALILFRNALILNPKYEDALYALGATYYEAGDYSSAIETLKELNNINPQFEDISITMGKCYASINAHKKAIYWFHRSLAKDREKREALLELGRAYYNRNKYDSAEYFLKKVLTESPTDTIARSYLSSIHIKQGTKSYVKGKYNDAIKCFEIAKQYSPGEATFNYLLLSYNRLKFFNQSDEIINEGLRQSFYDSSTVFLRQMSSLRAEFYRTIQKTERRYDFDFAGEVIKNGNKHVMMNPLSYDGYRQLGNIYIAIDSVKLGAFNLEKAFLIDSTDITVRLDLAEAYVISENTLKAHRHLKSILKSQTLTGRDKTVSYFLLAVTNIIRDEYDVIAQNELEKLITKKERIYDWSFYAFDRWLTKSGLPHYKHLKIYELTSRVKKLAFEVK